MRKLIFIFLLLFPTIIYAGYIGTNHIILDNDASDWTNKTGKYPISNPYNTNGAIVSGNQFIWQDAYGDDTGDGDYRYPAQTNWDNPHSMDIDQFRICWDSSYVYIYFREWNGPDFDGGNGWTHPVRIFGISTNKNTGSSIFIQGDGTSITNGPLGEIRSSTIKPDFVLYCAGTYKNWLWDNVTGKLLGTNFLKEEMQWNEIAVRIPISIIGSPENRTWYIIMGTGQQDGLYLREVWNNTNQAWSEWHGTGGDIGGNTNEANGVDPDIFDLIGASKILQEMDLNSYNYSGTPGDTNSFIDIQYSYVTVADFNKFHIIPEIIHTNSGSVIPLTILGCNTSYTGEFLNTNYTITVYNSIGTIIDNKFYATTNLLTSVTNGYIVFEMSGVTPYTLYVSITSNIATSQNLTEDIILPGFSPPEADKLLIQINTTSDSVITIEIFSLLGEKIKTIEKQINAGINKIYWDKTNETNNKVGSGLYIIKIKFQNKTFIKKILLVN